MKSQVTGLDNTPTSPALRRRLACGGSLAASAVLLLCVASPAAAQSPASAPQPAADPQADSTGQIADIIVTAQRRDERLQSVPVSISAFTADTIRSAGISDTASLQNITPGLVVGKSLSASTPFIRGIGTTDLGPSAESSVAVYLDGIYLVASPSSLFSFNNIARIEVLKGPQGTLFGRNATGGLIQVITRTPQVTPTGRFEAGLANYGTVSGSAFLSGGLGSNFSASIAAVGSRQGEGWGRNLFNGQAVGLSAEYGGQVKLRWQGINTDVTLATFYNYRDSDTGVNIQPYLGGGAGRLSGGVSFANDGKYNINNQIQPFGVSKTFVPTLTITEDLGFASLVSLTSYQKNDTSGETGPDGLPLQLSDAYLTLTSRAGTQELQLVSPASSPIKWIVGGFALARKGAYAPALNLTPGGIITTNGQQITHSYSGFVQTTVPLGDKTHLTGGLRYTRDEQSATVSRFFNGFPIGGPSADQVAFGKVTWRAALDHQATPDLLLYATANRGYKSGLFNVLNSPLSAGRARPETVDAFEVGFKSDLLGRRLRFNASAYYYNYKDLQVFFFLNGTAFTYNADKARIIGMEAEFTARPTNNLTLRGGINYMPEAKYIQFSTALRTTPLAAGGNSVVTGSVSGNRMARTPKITANLGADLTVPSPIGQFDLNVTASYQSKFFWQPESRLFQPPFVLLNSQVKLHVREHTWITVWGRNLTDKYYYTGGQSNPTGDVGTPGSPRTFGASIGADF